MKPPAPATFNRHAFAPTVAIPRTVHPDCRDFVTQVEVLLLRRHQEAAVGVMRRPIALTHSHSQTPEDAWDVWGPRKWHRKELEEMVYSSYKRMRQGHITRPPRRNIVLDIADYLNCTLEERNQLLLAAHTYPVEPYLTGAALERRLPDIIAIARALPMPAVVMNRDWQILYANAAILQLYDLSAEQIAAIPAASLNFLQLLVDPTLPLYAHLIGNRTSWTRMVLQTIQGFQRANRFSTYEPWFQEVVSRLLHFPAFARCWEQAETAHSTSMPSDGSDAPTPPVTLDTVVPALHDPSRPIALRPLVISLGYFQLDFPQIVGLLPAHASDQEIFRAIGLSAL